MEEVSKYLGLGLDATFLARVTAYIEDTISLKSKASLRESLHWKTVLNYLRWAWRARLALNLSALMVTEESRPRFAAIIHLVLFLQRCGACQKAHKIREKGSV